LADSSLEGSSGRLLTTAQVAERFQVDGWTVRRWVRQGKLPAIKLSGKYNRYRPEDVERIVAEGVPDKAYDQIADVLVREAARKAAP
jgi:excisionase family DNA binding protein